MTYLDEIFDALSEDAQLTADHKIPNNISHNFYGKVLKHDNMTTQASDVTGVSLLVIYFVCKINQGNCGQD